MIAGIDEAGRGSVIGPLVIALAEIKESDINLLTEMGVKDSKLLKRDKRKEIMKKVNNIAKFHYQIFNAKQIVEIMKLKSLNQLELEGMVELVNISSSKKVIIDCPSAGITSFSKDINCLLNTPKKLIIEHKADLNYVIVALASIAAKEKREDLIDILKEQFGDFGSGYPADPKAKAYLFANPEISIIRTNWGTWKNRFQTKLI
jgi:ribonuclease HII